MAQISHPYMTIGKTITLTRQTFVGKVMSLLFLITEDRAVKYSVGYYWVGQNVHLSFLLEDVFPNELLGQPKIMMDAHHYTLAQTHIMYNTRNEP